jgi:hypothetical protein
MADFVRIGRLIINVEQICAVARSQTGDEVVIFVTGKGPRDTGHFVVSGADAEKVWKHLTEGAGIKIATVSEG